MSIINSKVPSIQNLWIEPFPTKTIFNGRVVRVDRIHVGVDDKGRVFSSQVDKAFSYGLLSNFESTFKGLVKLGVISKADIKLHEDHRKKVDKERREQWAAESIEEQVKELGLFLTPKQKARIEAIKSRAKSPIY